MRATLCLLLAAACVASLVGEALADCALASWGITEEGHGVWAVKAKDKVVNVTNKSNVTVDIDYPWIGCDPVGVEAKFCEAHRLRFKQDFTVVALLNAGSPATEGLLSGVVYCKSVVGPQN